MASDPQIRDPHADELLTPENSGLVVIDYQPVQLKSLKSEGADEVRGNIQRMARIAELYGLPHVLSSVNVETGANEPTIPELTEILGDTVYDRTSINAWEDADFREAVRGMGRRKILLCALWTEACLTFPSLDMIREGYDVYAVVDAVGGTSTAAHETALRRLEQAGVKLTSWAQVICELQRDWNREDTAKEFAGILFGKPSDDA